MPARIPRNRFPEGAYVNLYATNQQIADLIPDPRVQGVSLTGSDAAGAAVAGIAGRHLKKVVLELGGLGIDEFVHQKLVRDIDRGRTGSPFRPRDVTRQLPKNVEHRRSAAAQKAV